MRFYEEEEKAITSHFNKEIEKLKFQKTKIKAQLGFRGTYENKDLMNSPVVDNSYKRDWTWDKKIDFFIEKAKGKPLTTGDIVDCVIGVEPELIKNSIRKSISSRLSVRVKAKDLIKIGVGDNKMGFVFNDEPPQ